MTNIDTDEKHPHLLRILAVLYEFVSCTGCAEDSQPLSRVVNKQKFVDVLGLYDLFLENKGDRPEDPQSIFLWMMNIIRQHVPKEVINPLFELQLVAHNECKKKKHKFKVGLAQHALSGFNQV